MRVVVIGAGYVGLVTGVNIARNGHTVTFVERSEHRRDTLRAGRAPIFEPGLQEALDEARDRIDVADAMPGGAPPDLVLIAVGTPIAEDGAPDESQVAAALAGLAERPELDVSVRSTLPPGTSVRLPRMLGRSDGRRISTNPEFLRQGSAMDDFAQPSRVVIGRFPETEARHLRKLGELYSGVDAPRLTVDVSAAELIKNVANGFLALKLSFVNEVASLSEEYGVDVGEVIEGIGLDPRIGTSYMRPGLGFGGSCLPKELEVLADAGRRQGLPMHIARAAALVNGEQQDRFARRLLAELGSEPARVGVLGLSFKPGTDDVRGSPALTVIRRLVAAGHRVVAYDPAVTAAETIGADVDRAGSAEEVFDRADAVAVATDWPEFAALDLAALHRRMRRPILYDGRNLFDPGHVVAAGLAYRGIGRPDADPAPSGADPAQRPDDADAAPEAPMAAGAEGPAAAS